jgi:hypothetical protein
MDLPENRATERADVGGLRAAVFPSESATLTVSTEAMLFGASAWDMHELFQ